MNGIIFLEENANLNLFKSEFGTHLVFRVQKCSDDQRKDRNDQQMPELNLPITSASLARVQHQLALIKSPLSFSIRSREVCFVAGVLI